MLRVIPSIASSYCVAFNRIDVTFYKLPFYTHHFCSHVHFETGVGAKKQRDDDHNKDGTE